VRGLAFLQNKWALAALVIFCWASATSFTAGYYYYHYNDLLAKVSGITIHVNLGINYGDNTPTQWFNGTEAKMGMTLLNVTMLVANVNYTPYAGLGAFLESINNKNNSYPHYWMWWMWTSWGGWIEGPIACDKYVVGDGETLFWYYEDTSISPLPKPPP